MCKRQKKIGGTMWHTIWLPAFNLDFSILPIERHMCMVTILRRCHALLRGKERRKQGERERGAEKGKAKPKKRCLVLRNHFFIEDRGRCATAKQSKKGKERHEISCPDSCSFFFSVSRDTSAHLSTLGIRKVH